MTGSVLFAIAALLASQSDASASVRLTAALAGASALPLPVSLELVATRTDGPGERRLPLVFSRAREVRIELDLAPGAWTIAAKAPGFWSEDTTVRVVQKLPTDIRIRAWPTATIKADLLNTGKTAALPRKMAAHFRGSPSDADEHRAPVGLVPCGVEDTQVSCEVPASRLDIRLVAPGLTPEYYWDVSLQTHETRALGRFRVEAGGSVIGYVRGADGRSASAVRVELHTPGGERIRASATPRRGARPSSELEEEQRRYPLLTTTNGRGFFQVRNVMPGEYRLVAMDDADAAAETSVKVAEDSESALPDFLSLGAPFALDVSVEPPVHPRGSAWTIALTRLLPFEAVRTQTVSDSGAARLERVGRGRYLLEVFSDGEKWLSQSLEVDAAPGPVVIKIAVVTVRGRLRLAGKPLRAILSFGGRSAAQVIAFEADDRGEFGGYLPKPGRWPVWVFAGSTQPPVDRMLRAVEVEADESGLAIVDIDLEDARLKGRVLDEEGRGVRAFVDLEPAATGSRETSGRNSLRTDPEGRFEVRGLAPGAYIVAARAEGDKESEPSTLTLSDSGAEVTLVVRDLMEVGARVFSAATGDPLPGARALAWPADQLGQSSPAIVTDPEGRFSLRVPRATRALVVLHWADGHAIHLGREPLPPRGELILEAEPLGGTLLVDLPARLRVPMQVSNSETQAVLVRRGGAFLVSTLGTIVRQRASATGPVDESSAIVLPGMAAGDYALCEVSLSVFFANVGIPFDPSRCGRGSLPAGGELRLTLSGGSETPSGAR